MTPAQAKTASHGFLRQHSVQIGEALPPLEPVEELCPQDAASVATRSIVLRYVMGIGFGVEARSLKASLQEFGLFEHTSAQEQGLLSRPEHTQKEKINATWLTECIQSLPWCLGLVDLDPFRRCDDDLASHFLQPFSDPGGFISGATLRPFDEIYLQADLHYRLRWATREARLMGTRCPVEQEVIAERRKALDWVIGVEANWDEIPLDT